MDMDIQNNSFLSIDQLANQYLNSSRKTVKAAQENLVSFQEILQNKSQEQNVSGTQDLKFSKHALLRLGFPTAPSLQLNPTAKNRQIVLNVCHLKAFS